MANSMTAYGRAVKQTENKLITVELKSVNNRYFDCSVKLPRTYSPLEDKVRSFIQAGGISRGKIDVFITVSVISGQSGTIVLDEEYAESYIKALRTLSEKFGLTNDITTMRVASNRDIFVALSAEEDTEKDWEELLPVLSEALENFRTMRKEEGGRLIRDISAKKEYLVTLAAKVGELASAATEKYRAKLEAKLRQTLADMAVTPDENRILTECAIYADKVAVDEELVRLASHFKAFDDMLESSEPIGRKIDFLLQEMNREVNTTGSKCNDSDIAHLVVDMKAELEKIREQIQNIE